MAAASRCAAPWGKAQHSASTCRLANETWPPGAGGADSGHPAAGSNVSDRGDRGNSTGRMCLNADIPYWANNQSEYAIFGAADRELTGQVGLRSHGDISD